jgi:hypothetical protein
LLELALSENLNIVSLQTEGNNLEEIFRTLRKNRLHGNINTVQECDATEVK